MRSFFLNQTRRSWRLWIPLTQITTGASLWLDLTLVRNSD